MMSDIDKHDNLGAKKDEEIDICVNSKDDSVTKRPGSEVSDSNKRYQTLQRRKTRELYDYTTPKNILLNYYQCITIKQDTVAARQVFYER